MTPGISISANIVNFEGKTSSSISKFSSQNQFVPFLPNLTVIHVFHWKAPHKTLSSVTATYLKNENSKLLFKQDLFEHLKTHCIYYSNVGSKFLGFFFNQMALKYDTSGFFDQPERTKQFSSLWISIANTT